MKNKQRGNTLAIVAIVVIVGITIGTFLFLWWSSRLTSQEYTARIQKIITAHESSRQANPPSGFLVLSKTPVGYILDSSYFSTSTASWKYVAHRSNESGSHTYHVSFNEGPNSLTYDDYIKTHAMTETSGEVIRAIDAFTYNGFNGSVLATYINQNMSQATTTTNEYSLIYNHNGKLVMISTDDGYTITPAVLIDMLKTTTLAQ